MNRKAKGVCWFFLAFGYTARFCVDEVFNFRKMVEMKYPKLRENLSVCGSFFDHSGIVAGYAVFVGVM